MARRLFSTLLIAWCGWTLLHAIDFTPQREAGSLRAKGDYLAAAAKYDSIASDANTQDYLRMEAQMLAQECRNLAAGLLARDPSATREPLPDLSQYPVAATLHVSPGKTGAFDAALKSARKIHATAPDKYVVIRFAPGTYHMTQTMKLEAADSYIILQGDGQAIFDGAVPITNWETWKGQIMVANVPKGVEPEYQHEFGAGAGRPVEEGRYTIDLYENNHPMVVARWPNDSTVNFTTANEQEQTFDFPNERVQRWANAKGLMAMGWWKYKWREGARHIEVVDAKAGRIRIVRENGGKEPIEEKEPMPFFVFNTLEELDSPGEWYYDVEEAKIYVWPREKEATYTFPTFKQTFLRVDDASHVIVTGMVFRNGRQHAVRFANTNQCMLLSSVIERFGGYGLISENCWDFLAQDNTLSTFSHGGMVVRTNADDPKPSGIRIVNNKVSHFLLRARTYCPALELAANYAEVLHNTFSDGASSAIRYAGSYSTIAYNRVERVVQESDDQGGIDMYGNPYYYNNRIMFNLWKNIGGGNFATIQGGIRLDDMISFTLIYGNIFSEASRGRHFGAVQIHGGRANIVDNNVVLHGDHFMSCSPWLHYMPERTKSYVDPARKPYFMKGSLTLPEPPAEMVAILGDSTYRDVNYFYRNRAFDIKGAPLTAPEKNVWEENNIYGNAAACFAPIGGDLYRPSVYAEEMGTYPQNETNKLPKIFCPEKVEIRKLVESTPRGGLPNFYQKLESKQKEVVIAYLGGSITEQEGYRIHSQDYFQAQYPDTKVTGIHAAIGGTGSNLGTYRCWHDVLQHKPDLVFVEFAVNDGGTAPIEIRKNMEGIVRQIWKAYPRTDIVFVYTLTSSNIGEMLKGNMARSASVMEELADYYGIPSIHMGLEVLQLIKDDKLIMKAKKEDMTRVAGAELNAVAGSHATTVNGIPANADGRIPFAPDGVHPYADTGHQLYMRAIARSLPAIKASGKPGAHVMYKPMVANCVDEVATVPFTDPRVHIKGDHSVFAGDNHEIAYYLNRCDKFHIFEVGTEISFKFKGKEAAFYDILGPGGATMSVSVDGQPAKEYTRFDSYCSYNRLSFFSICKDLDPNKVHNVVIKVLDKDVDKAGILGERGPKELQEHPEKYKVKRFIAGNIFIAGKMVN